MGIGPGLSGYRGTLRAERVGEFGESMRCGWSRWDDHMSGSEPSYDQKIPPDAGGAQAPAGRREPGPVTPGRSDSRGGVAQRLAPDTARNPESGLPFTEASAWDLLVQLLEDGHPMQETVLDHPPGARGFVLLVDLEGSSQTLYVKVQLGARCVIGRSFHYSYEPGLHGTRRVRRDD